MNESSILHSSLLEPARSKSAGVKLIAVCGLVLLMTVPVLFVAGLVSERAQRAADVTTEISRRMGGPQTFLGPTLLVPYRFTPGGPAGTATTGTYLVFPSQASAALKTVTEERHRSLFRVPVYQADITFDAVFDLADVPNAAPHGAELDWSRAEIVVGVSDTHGALADATLTTATRTYVLAPAQTTGSLPLETNDNQPATLTLLGASPGDTIKAGTSFRVKSALRFSGAERISVLAYGRTTHLSAQGDWHNPGFDGGILPVRWTITPTGFTVNWSMPFIARGVRAQGPISAITGLNSTALGVSFIEVANSYQSVSRSLKYAPLFLGLVFLSYFVFEVTSNTRVHPAQYILVGIAQLVFYLLLLSLSERTGFDIAFSIAGMATVTLLSTNAGWTFSSHLQALRALAIFSLLYSMIYLLLRLEDNALLVGAIVSFLAVAATMYFTRGIDWYATSRRTDALNAR